MNDSALCLFRMKYVTDGKRLFVLVFDFDEQQSNVASLFCAFNPIATIGKQGILLYLLHLASLLLMAQGALPTFWREGNTLCRVNKH